MWSVPPNLPPRVQGKTQTDSRKSYDTDSERFQRSPLSDERTAVFLCVSSSPSISVALFHGSLSYWQHSHLCLYVSRTPTPPFLRFGPLRSSFILFYFIFSSTSLSSLIVNLNFFLFLLPASPPPRLSLSHLHHPPPSSSSSLLVFVSYIILSFVPFSPFKFITHHVFYSHPPPCFLPSFQFVALHIVVYVAYSSLGFYFVPSLLCCLFSHVSQLQHMFSAQSSYAVWRSIRMYCKTICLPSNAPTPTA